MDRPITRRRFFGLGAAGAVALAGGSGPLGAATAGVGRFTARLTGATGSTGQGGKPAQPVQPGLHELGLARGKDGIFAVPKGYSAEKPVPLIVMLHGARGRTEGFTQFCQVAAESGMAAAAPDARGQTWDLVLGGYGPDIAFLDRVLAHLFARIAVDPRRVALAGFSDGGSYALSVGLANGDLFTHVMAYSPGFMQPPGREGKPAVWISHGTRDDILPIDGTSRRLVPRLKQWGYKVTYREFNGGHELSPEIGLESFRWFKS